MCSLQVDAPQVSGRGDGVALRAQLLVPLWRKERGKLALGKEYRSGSRKLANASTLDYIL